MPADIQTVAGGLVYDQAPIGVFILKEDKSTDKEQHLKMLETDDC